MNCCVTALLGGKPIPNHQDVSLDIAEQVLEKLDDLLGPDGFELFFNLRPALALPFPNRGFVPFQGAAHRLLHVPVQLPEDAPNVPRMITDLEIPLDQVGHALTGPQRSFIAQTLWALREQVDQAGFIGLIQTGKPSRVTSTPQRHITAFLVLPAPPADGLVADLQATTNLAIVEPLAEQLHGGEPTFFQCPKVALQTSRIAYAESDAAEPQ
jgi:hypothetical protein